MKKIQVSLAFVLAIGAAVYGYATTSPLAPRFYQADPNNKAATCRTILCTDQLNAACTFITPGYSTYVSLDGQPNCNSPVTLYKQP